ncbi:MAG: hypothetical protein H6805_11950 [Planctomycetes bacterium]|nr:hypothetical protein [Planctomycetota bacterium]
MLHVGSRALVALVLALGLGACGGGGGGTPTDPRGTFDVVALEGETLPGPTLGEVGELPTGGGSGDPVMALATGGWSAAVVPTTNGSVPWIVMVLDPSGTQVEALAAGALVPTLVDGTMDAVTRLWITGDGHVLAYVAIAGNTEGRTWALVSVEVAGGTAGAPVHLASEFTGLVSVSLPGSMRSLDPADVIVDDNGRAWFLAHNDSDDPVLLSAPVDGSSLSAHARPGDALPGAVTLVEIKSFGVEPAGTRFALVAGASDATDRLVTGVPGGLTYDQVGATGDTLFGGGVIAELHVGDPLIVYGGNNVVWHARGSLSANDDLLLLASPLAGEILARRGGAAASTGGGTFGTLRLLEQESDATIPYFAASVIGSGNGITFALYGVTSPTEAADIAVWNGRSIGGTTLGTTFPSLDRPPLLAAARNGDLAFANVMTDARSAVYWLIPFTGFIGAAISGDSTPMGDTWGAFAPTAFVTTAQGAIQWQGRLATAGTDGLFRFVR